MIKVKYQPTEYELDYFDGQFYCVHADTERITLETEYGHFLTDECTECNKWYNNIEEVWCESI